MLYKQSYRTTDSITWRFVKCVNICQQKHMCDWLISIFVND